MNLPKLLAIHGLAYSGKDELAEHLARTHGYKKYRIARPLEDCISSLLPGIAKEFKSTRKEDPIPGVDRSWRQLMQNLGMWVREEFGETGLIDRILESYLSDRNLPDCRYLIYDVRLPKEAELIRWVGGTLIHITRPNASAANPDITECGIHAAHGEPVFLNTGTLPELFATVDDWLSRQ